MKQTKVGKGCNFEVITFHYISICFQNSLKMSAKYAQQSMILTYQIFCVPDHYRGHMTLHFPSISKHLEKFTILTDQIIHT